MFMHFTIFFAAHLFFVVLSFFSVYLIYIYTLSSAMENKRIVLYAGRYIFSFGLLCISFKIVRTKNYNRNRDHFEKKTRSICNFAFLSFFFKLKLNIHHSIFIILCVDRIYQISFFAQFSHSV